MQTVSNMSRDRPDVNDDEGHDDGPDVVNQEKIAKLSEENTLESLKELVALLSHRRIRVRYEASKAASGLVAWGPEGRDAFLSVQPDPLPTLISMIKDTHDGCASWALSALANLCTEGISERMIKENAVVLTMNRILTGQSQSEEALDNASKLLANLTRHHEGRQSAIGFLSDGSHDERAKDIAKLCELFFESRTGMVNYGTGQLQQGQGCLLHATVSTNSATHPPIHPAIHANTRLPRSS